MNTPLSRLAALLGQGTEIAAKSMTVPPAVDSALEAMRLRTTKSTPVRIQSDQQLLAIRTFWDTHEIPGFREAYLLSWGLCLPHREKGFCILEDNRRLKRVLEKADEYLEKPRVYRRCYQGLSQSYFAYSYTSQEGRVAAAGNWPMFREYLHARSSCIRDEYGNPEWVQTAINNKDIFGRDPCSPYVMDLLHGDTRMIDQLCDHLSIGKASWFLDKLVMAQVRKSTTLSHDQFLELLQRLLDVLEKNEVQRDAGLRLLLDRYADIPGHLLHQPLRDMSVFHWGNPWLPSNEARWGGVAEDTRRMVSDWLKLEFIEAFFTKLAEDGLGDPRRMKFWKRYVKAIDHIEFALGSFARNTTEPDFVALRKKMKGIICTLDASGTNNAFIMRMGDLVAVEFSDLGNALYGYNATTVPFDTRKNLFLPSSTPNSLKQKPRAVLWQGHHGIKGSGNSWENIVESKLAHQFGIQPDQMKRHRGKANPPSSATASSKTTAQAAKEFQHAKPYSLDALALYVRQHGLSIRDNSSIGGSVWVYAGTDDSEIGKTLTRWGFQYRPGKGWWK
ncbi:MAG: hypothetical protein HYZ45_06860 [Burkholderiales bacterium]|nr:hypothetical protein [Burkholderiales bacterium]